MDGGGGGGGEQGWGGGGRGPLWRSGDFVCVIECYISVDARCRLAAVRSLRLVIARDRAAPVAAPVLTQLMTMSLRDVSPSISCCWIAVIMFTASFVVPYASDAHPFSAWSPAFAALKVLIHPHFSSTIVTTVMFLLIFLPYLFHFFFFTVVLFQNCFSLFFVYFYFQLSLLFLCSIFLHF